MKIIHCADLHLDSTMTANLEKEKAKERKNELLKTFCRMMEYADREAVSAIIIAGDLFDKKRISATARNTVYEEIRKYPEIEVYYVRGNHDADGFLENIGSIPDNLYLFGEQWQSYAVQGNRKVTVTGMELDAKNSGTFYHTLTLEVDTFNIVVLHGQEAAYRGNNRAEVISLPQLCGKEIDYLALGHIHAYKEGRLDGRGSYCYPGCLEGRGFDECGEHGFVLLDIDEQQRRYDKTFIPFACRNLYTVEVDISDCTTSVEIARQMRQAFSDGAYAQRSLVKTVLRGEVDIACEKNTDWLQKQFENEFYFLKISDESKWKVDYDSFRYDESLKGEFVRTVMQEEDMSDEEKRMIIRYGIQALAGEEMQ